MSSILIEKLKTKQTDLKNAPTPTVAFFGDSVTQGCFECYELPGNRVETVYEQNHSYGARLAEILNLLYPRATINLIFAGVSGDNATHAAKRLERDVLSHHPDLVIVGFALNDCMKGTTKLETYVDSLKEIFAKVKESGADCIFLTPNDMCDHLSEHVIGDPFFEKLATDCMNAVNNGYLKSFVEAATELSEEMGVTVCPVYDKWQKMKNAGVNTTELLANKLNHPCREITYFTAWSLLETILEM